MSKGFYGSNGEYNIHGGTPDYILEELEDEFGLLYDPCPNNPKYDGLFADWGFMVHFYGCNAIYVNPPYARGQISKWVKKSYEESLKNPDIPIIMLIPVYTDTIYFHEFIYGKAKLRFIRGRLKFKGYNNKASFPSMLVVFNENKDL